MHALLAMLPHHKWKARPNQKDNALQEASTLSDFASENIVSVHEVIEALDVEKSKIFKFEATLENIKEAMASEYRKET